MPTRDQDKRTVFWLGAGASAADGAPLQGASVDDGVATMRAMVAIARSVESGKPIRLAEVSGEM